jgi:hypothetical protein
MIHFTASAEGQVEEAMKIRIAMIAVCAGTLVLADVARAEKG